MGLFTRRKTSVLLFHHSASWGENNPSSWGRDADEPFGLRLQNKWNPKESTVQIWCCCRGLLATSPHCSNTARLRVSTAFWFTGLWVGYLLINHNIHSDISSFKLWNPFNLACSTLGCQHTAGGQTLWKSNTCRYGGVLIRTDGLVQGEARVPPMPRLLCEEKS